MNYLIISYPDGHGSVELLDQNNKVIGLCSIFSSEKQEINTILEILRSKHTEISIKFLKRESNE